MFTKFIVFLSKKFLICHFCPFFGTYYIIQCSHKAREKQNFSQNLSRFGEEEKNMKIIVSRINLSNSVQNQQIGMKDGKLVRMCMSIIRK